MLLFRDADLDPPRSGRCRHDPNVRKSPVRVQAAESQRRESWSLGRPGLPDQQLPRPGEPAGGFPDNPSPGALAATANTTGSNAPGNGAAAKPSRGNSLKAARRLRIAKRLKLTTFALRGLRITIDVPATTTVLALKLTRRTHGRLRTVLAGTLQVKKVPSTGRVVLHWKAGRKAVSTLFAGTDVLRARVGRDRDHLGTTLAASVRLVGPRISAKATRTQRRP